MTGRSLQGWLEYYDAGQRGRVNLGLDRVREAAHTLNLLPLAYPSVIVGGTNGKGSTSTSIARVLEHAHHRVGLYTSPHVFAYNERIAINSEPVSDQALCQAFETIHQACSHIFLSYFEVGLLACLLIFQQEQVELGVFEVGLGGRLDAVNIIDPQVSVITSIHFDHMAFLGNTLEAIAFEKAGIMRAQTPVIYGGENPPWAIINQANNLQAPLLVYQRDFKLQEQGDERIWTYGEQIQSLPITSMHPSNMAAAVMALHCLNPYLQTPDPSMIRQTFETIQVLGRYQRMQRNCPWIFDVAHNPQAVEYLMERVKKEVVQGKKIAIFCCMVDKDIAGMMSCFCPQFDEVYLVPLAIPRAASTQDLYAAYKAGQEHYPSTKAQVFDSIPAAILNAEKATPQDAVFVFGSFYLVEGVLRGI